MQVWRRFKGMAVAAACALSAAPGGAQDLSALARLVPEGSAVLDAGPGVRIDLALTQPVPYRVFVLDDPPRLVLDSLEIDFSAADPARLDRSERVQALRLGRFRPGWSRLVAVLDGPYRIVSAEERGAPATIRVLLDPATEAEFAAAVAAAPDPAWGLPEPADLPPAKPRQTGAGPLIVALDPGHGGLDPGAEAKGLTEAELMLVFGRELAEVLRRAGMVVVMTREEDVFVPLAQRIRIAREAGADVFLSLHADALAEGFAQGATVYTLADEASDAASEKLAERHDRADLLAGVDLSETDDAVALVLMDLARTETAPRTERLAVALVEGIYAATQSTYKRPHLQAAFSVLKAPDIPSALIELGFLSSERDRIKLADPTWRLSAAEGIRDALLYWALEDAAVSERLRQ